jgi:hypothetical protein
MILEHYKPVLILAIFLLLFGCTMPFLIVLDVVKPTMFLLFVTYGASVLGLFLGIAGIAGARISQKSKSDRENPYK